MVCSIYYSPDIGESKTASITFIISQAEIFLKNVTFSINGSIFINKEFCLILVQLLALKIVRIRIRNSFNDNI